jgi:acetoin utilization protein AcuB
MIPPQLERIPAVKAVMTPFPYHVEAEDPLEQAARLMKEHGIRHLPVERNERLVGIVSDRDLRLAESASPEAATRGELRVEDAMMSAPYTVDLETPLDYVALEMARRHIGSALVTRHGRLAGIFTATDACNALARILRELFPRDGGDAA